MASFEGKTFKTISKKNFVFFENGTKVVKVEKRICKQRGEAGRKKFSGEVLRKIKN